MSSTEKNPALLAHEDVPLNAETPPELLCRSFITPNDLFFARNHAPVPPLDPTTYRLTIDGLVTQPLTLTLDDLKTRYPKHTLTATLMCAGNRRIDLHRMETIHDEVPWENGAIGTAVWGGARLSDLLREVGVQAGAQHIAFLGADRIEKEGDNFGFGGSAPLDKADDILLAYEMNGEPLPPLHGYPVRGLVAGYIGARSVKWLTQITLQSGPSQNYYQQAAYKLFPPQVREQDADWDAAPMLGELIVTSVIATPAENATLPPGRTQLKGYALAGGDAQVTLVEISCDGGRSWQPAQLDDQTAPHSWRLWHAALDLTPGEHELAVRATDSAGNIQPEKLTDVWNFKGYMNNAWQRVRVRVSTG